jgi:hypothetical protein
MSSVGRNLAMGRCPFQGALLKCLNGFRVSEVGSEWGKAMDLIRNMRKKSIEAASENSRHF